MSGFHQASPPPGFELELNPPDNLEQLAFNTNGFAIPTAPFATYRRRQVVRVKYSSSTGIGAEDLDTMSRPTSAALSASETRLGGVPHSERGLIVGVAPKGFRLLGHGYIPDPDDPEENPYADHAHPNAPVSEYLGDPKSFVVLKRDSCAPRVVARLAGRNMERSQVWFHILLEPNHEGVFKAYRISLDQVFFFPQYRSDDACSLQEKKQWMEIVRSAAMASDLFPASHASSPDVANHPNPSNNTAAASPVPLPANATFQLVHRTLSMALISRDLHALQNVPTMAAASALASEREFADKPMLLKLFCEQITERDVQIAHTQWKRLIGGQHARTLVTAPELSELNEAVVASGIDIECRMIHYLVVNFVQRLRSARLVNATVSWDDIAGVGIIGEIVNSFFQLMGS